MHILCLGLNHHTADVALREQLAFDEQSIRMALSRLSCERDSWQGFASEMVILSTCHRVELYAVSPQSSFEELETFLETARGAPRQLFSSHLYRYANEEAVAHLFAVAAGLDSLILGEPQILGQVAKALNLARSLGAAGRILTRLFQSAIHAGKRARTETSIAQNPATISSLAARLIADTVPDLARSRLAVLGAGEMAELAVEALIKRGARHIHVINRTAARAHVLAEKWGALPASFEDLPEILTDLDILIASTGAPHVLVPLTMVESAMKRRPTRPLIIVDIAVPRDVDAKVANLPGVTLYDLDGLSHQLGDSLERRSREVPLVEEILKEERAAFMHFLTELEILPLIAMLRQRADSIAAREVEKTLRRMPHLTREDQEQIEAMTRSIVKKILHQPTITLRDRAGMPEAAEFASVTRNLFGLEN